MNISTFSTSSPRFDSTNSAEGGMEGTTLIFFLSRKILFLFAVRLFACGPSFSKLGEKVGVKRWRPFDHRVSFVYFGATSVSSISKFSTIFSSDGHVTSKLRVRQRRSFVVINLTEIRKFPLLLPFFMFSSSLPHVFFFLSDSQIDISNNARIVESGWTWIVGSCNQGGRGGSSEERSKKVKEEGGAEPRACHQEGNWLAD